MPTLMAIPARLMMFDGMPSSFIIRKLNRIASGRLSETMNAPPRCPMMSRIATVQIRSSSLTVSVTVSSALRIRGVRS